MKCMTDSEFIMFIFFKWDGHTVYHWAEENHIQVWKEWSNCPCHLSPDTLLNTDWELPIQPNCDKLYSLNWG